MPQFCSVQGSPPDSYKYTGGEHIGGIKKKSKAELEYVAEKLEHKAMLAKEEATRARAAVEEKKAADARKAADEVKDDDDLEADRAAHSA